MKILPVSASQKISKLNEFYRKQLATTQITIDSSAKLAVLRGLPFYDWTNHQNYSTFNHVIGLPQKNEIGMRLFDYEKIIFDILSTDKHVWIKKATGLGITEFMLRYMAWLCLKDDKLRGCQMGIVVGPNIDKAIELIRRMKQLFMNLGASFDFKETVIELNNVRIEAYPSHHVDTMRSLTNPKFFFIDEGDFFPPGQQIDARKVSERYIAKSNPYIVMVSTPNKPDGLFEQIEQETESACLYKRLFLDYTYGINNIFTAEEIEQAKRSPSFQQEYNLMYLGLIGNVFHTKDIEAAIDRGREMDYERQMKDGSLYYKHTRKSVGLDPGFGSSNFGVCVTELVDGYINILHAEEYARTDFDEMLEIVIDLLIKYNVSNDNANIYCDASNPSWIRALKKRVGEETNFEATIAWLKKNWGHRFTESLVANSMLVLPIAFSTTHRQMLAHCKKLMELNGGNIIINPNHTKLITALRTAVEKGDGILDKDATSYDDLFDAFRMACLYYK